MQIRNERAYPVFLRYAGKGRAGRNLAQGELSPECPLDRLHQKVVQRHITEKAIHVYVSKEEHAAIKGNIPDEILELLDTGKRVGEKKGVAPAAPVAAKHTPEPKQAPKIEDQPKSKHLNEEGQGSNLPQTAADLTADPIQAHAKKEEDKEAQEAPAPEAPAEEKVEEMPPEAAVDAPAETEEPKEAEAPAAEEAPEPPAEKVEEPPAKEEPKKAPAKKKTAAKKTPAKKAPAKKAPAKKEEAPAKRDYKELNKKQLFAEIEKRELKKPAASTSTTRLREKLIKDDESK